MDVNPFGFFNLHLVLGSLEIAVFPHNKSRQAHRYLITYQHNSDGRHLMLRRNHFVYYVGYFARESLDDKFVSTWKRLLLLLSTLLLIAKIVTFVNALNPLV